VIEPGAMAKAAGWAYREGQAGWGSYDAMLKAMDHAVGDRDYLLGSEFSMADVIFGGTVRYMIGFKMIEPLPALAAYAERLAARPALKRAEARNAAVVEERGLRR
jgi:glutathione S-transferase